MDGNSIEWGVLDNESGYVHVGFKDRQDALDWADPTKGNPNWGDWTVVSREVTDWTAS